VRSARRHCHDPLVADLARRLVTTGRHAEPVKAGIVLLGVSGSGQDRELLLTLGRHEEFTLFCAVAIRNCQPEPDRVLWSLARLVDGGGRIYAVERLQNTDDEEIRDWMAGTDSATGSRMSTWPGSRRRRAGSRTVSGGMVRTRSWSPRPARLSAR
jgi:hypothetical protein